MTPRPDVELRTDASTGILLSLVAYALFTLVDSAIKTLGGRYHVVQFVFFNALFAFTTVTLIALFRGRLAGIASPQWRLHLLRWAIVLPGGLAIFRAYPRTPLADVYAILPLFMTALAVPILGERVG